MIDYTPKCEKHLYIAIFKDKFYVKFPSKTEQGWIKDLKQCVGI